MAKQLFMARIKLLDMGLTIAATTVEMQLANPPADMAENEAYALWAKEQFDAYIDKISKGRIKS
jgi:hypothetical protein